MGGLPGPIGVRHESTDRTYVKLKCVYDNASRGGGKRFRCYERRSSLSHAHRSMGFFLNKTFTLAAADSVRPIDYSVSDIRVEFTPAPTPSSRSSFSHTHRSMVFFQNQTFALAAADAARPIDYSVSDIRVEFTPSPTP